MMTTTTEHKKNKRGAAALLACLGAAACFLAVSEDTHFAVDSVAPRRLHVSSEGKTRRDGKQNKPSKDQHRQTSLVRGGGGAEDKNRERDLSILTSLATYNEAANRKNQKRELFMGAKVIDKEEISRELFQLGLSEREDKVHDTRALRDLSIDLGNSQCKWTEPHDAPHAVEAEMFQTLVVAYPGSGKRMAFMHLSGITSLTTGDDYDLSGNSLHTAFMKSSYPHYEGIWSWGNRMDQSILVMRNPRWAIVDYHNMLYELEYTASWEEAYEHTMDVWSMKAPMDVWIEWRERMFPREIHRWSWFIDFWMENGLLRDILTHRTANQTWWDIVTNPREFPYPSLDGYTSPETTVRNYHCIYDLPDDHGSPGGCQPKTVISLEKLVDETTGPAEGAKIAAALEGNQHVTVISPEAQECIWKELFKPENVAANGDIADVRLHRRSVLDPPKEMYQFTRAQMETMLAEMTRLKEKYSTTAWQTIPAAQELVVYLNGYIEEVSSDVANGSYEPLPDAVVGTNHDLLPYRVNNKFPGLYDPEEAAK